MPCLNPIHKISNRKVDYLHSHEVYSQQKQVLQKFNFVIENLNFYNV